MGNENGRQGIVARKFWAKNRRSAEVCRSTFQGRKSLKQMLIDKALTSESMDKWKQTLLKMKNRMQAGRAEAEVCG